MTLDGFELFDFSEGVPYVSVTQNGVTFNRSVVIKLGMPDHVQLLINSASMQIAIRVCDASAKNAVAFYKPKASGIMSVRWNGRDLLNRLEDIAHWDLKQQGYRIDGTHLRDQNIMLFDLSKATAIT